MITLDEAVGFQWDEGNASKNWAGHMVSQAEAEQVFLNQPLLLLADTGHSKSEDRFHALGQTSEGRLLHLSFTLREKGTLIRLISARDMHRKEKLRYAQET